jgi:GNAT superfamily N-acetyltransferase
MYPISLIPSEEIHSIIPLLQLLNPDISSDVLKERLDEMILQGYECVGVFDREKLIGISGLWTLTKYYVGRHMEPDNVVIHPDYRGQKIGEELMAWIFDYARSKGCIASELNCYVNNEGGQKFWFRHGYKILGFHFQKKLK